MDELIFGVLDILSNYDATLDHALTSCEVILDDTSCGEDTRLFAQGLLVAIILDKAAPLIPEDDEKQEQVMAAAVGLSEVMEKIPRPVPLIYQVALGYAVALSQSRNGWHPWERVRDFVLEEGPDPQ
jgi:hypothetical protein